MFLSLSSLILILCFCCWTAVISLVAEVLYFRYCLLCYCCRLCHFNFHCKLRTSAKVDYFQNFFFDLRQPVLLHSKRTSRKVFARCVRKGPGGTMKELLPEVVIPEDYAGYCFTISKYVVNFQGTVIFKW